MTAAEIAKRLGGARRSGRWWSCRCPAHDDQSPSLSLRDGDRGLILRCWAGCDLGDVLAELRRRGLIWGSRSGEVRAPLTVFRKDHCDRSDDPARRVALARRIWNAAQDASGTPVTAYLAGR